MGAEATPTGIHGDDVEQGALSHLASGMVPSRTPPLLAAGGFALVLFAISATGAVVLVWWIIRFHPDDTHLWMVPVSLVLLGTPIVSWFSVCASDVAEQFENTRATTVIISGGTTDAFVAPGVMVGGDGKRRW